MRATLALLTLLAGCGEAIDATGGGGNAQSALIGSWLSAGADVAPLLAAAPFNNVQITATFNTDKTYAVLGIDKDNKMLPYNGTYELTESDVPGIFNIVCHQVMPQTATAEGMLQIDTTVMPARMQYEVVQTQPTNGLTPPTADGGFGSTLYNGKQISTLIQKFSKQ
jgi:hypothetical protein